MKSRKEFIVGDSIKGFSKIQKYTYIFFIHVQVENNLCYKLMPSVRGTVPPNNAKLFLR